MPKTMFAFAWLCAGLLFAVWAEAAEPKLVGHWPFRGDVRDHSGNDLKATAKEVNLEVAGPAKEPRGAAGFNGRASRIDVAEAPQLGHGEFSLSLWANTDANLGDSVGDLLSRYDPATRTGFHLGLYNHGGVTNSQSNSRQLHFGIDQGKLEPAFKDHGRVGNAVYVFALCVHDGHLYASTCHAGAGEAGRVFRFEGGDHWKDLGSPDKANAISAMAVHNGRLFVASSKYRLAGSALAESENKNFGGKIFELGDNDQWIARGALPPETEAVASLVVFRGKLYAASLYRPAGFYVYENETWMACATPGKRVEALTVFNDALYGTSYDEGSVFRFDGEKWEHLGTLPDATQTYGFAIHRGELYVSEWPKAHVFRLSDGKWVDTGKLGQELEAMPLLVYNGKMYGGTLPSAEVYRYDGDMNWAKIGVLDTTDTKYRRAWSMAVHQGRLFTGTLPSGHVLSIEAGRNVTSDHELKPGWHHLAAIRAADRLRLFVDGKQVAESAPFSSQDFDLTTSAPLQIGFGAQNYFRGDLSDVRLYQGALSAEQVLELAKKAP